MSSKNTSEIQAVIFDMDGLLIDSEPLWRRAEMFVLCPLGVPLTEERCLETLGRRTDELVDYWYQKHPWRSPSPNVVVKQIEEKLTELVRNEGEMMEGVEYIFSLFEKHGIRRAIASSSSSAIIEVVLKKLELHSRIELYHSAEGEPFGKPHPAVYLSTLKKLGVPASAAIAFEDSPNGIRSAHAAGIRTVWIPQGEVVRDNVPADLELSSLNDFTARFLSTRTAENQDLSNLADAQERKQ